MTDKKDFEKWISSPPFEYSIEKWPDNFGKWGWPGQYKDIKVQLAWDSWREAISRVESEMKLSSIVV